MESGKQPSVFQATHDQQAWISWSGSARGSLQQPGTDVSAAVICPVSTADICPVSTEDIYPVSTEDATAASLRPAAVMSSVETG